MNNEMKKWLPYKSIVEQEDFLNKLLYQKYKIEKPTISEDKAEEINNILSSYTGEELEIKYFDDGYIKTTISCIYKIGKNQKRIYLSKYEYIDFTNILDLNVK